MPSYDALHYDPPAPIAQVSLRVANGATLDDVLLLLDTGADTTLLPRSAITRLGITPDPALAYDLIGFDGTRSTTQAVDLDMIFLQKAVAASRGLPWITTLSLGSRTYRAR